MICFLFARLFLIKLAKNGLSDEASTFYKTLSPIITKLSPIGLNRGNMLFNQNYLDD